MNYVELIGYIAGVLTMVAFLPQSIKTIKSRDVRGLSLLSYTIYFTGIFSWVAYGYFIGSNPMVIFNSICLLTVAPILYMLVRYKR